MGDRDIELGNVKQGSSILGRTEDGIFEIWYGEGIFIECSIRKENV
jgi:hypothetical protein